MRSKNLGLELLFDDESPGGTITDVLPDGFGKKFKLEVDDVLLEVTTPTEDVLLNEPEDAESISIGNGKKVSVLFRKKSDGHLHKRTIVVVSRTWSEGDPCVITKVDESTIKDIILD